MKYKNNVIHKIIFEWIVNEYKRLHLISRITRDGNEDIWKFTKEARYAIIYDYNSPTCRWNGDVLVVLWPGVDTVDLFRIIDGKLKRIRPRMIEGVDEGPQIKI